jgi:sorting nexin-25
MEFMDRRGRMRLVQFWLLVNNIKDPLEDADSDPLPQHSTWTQNDIDDLSAILDGYFSDPILEVDEPIKSDLATFLKDPSNATVEQYQCARKAILITQQTVYLNMEREDWPLFQKTDLWHKYLSAADSAPATPARPALPQPKPPPPAAMARSHSAGMLPSRPVGVVAPRNESATDLRKLLRKTPATRIPSEESHPSSEDAESRSEDFPSTNPHQSEEEVVNAISAALNDIIKSDAKDDLSSIHSRTSSDLGDRPYPNSARSSIDIPYGNPEPVSIVDDGRMSADRSDSVSQSEPQRERVPIFDDDDDYHPDFAMDTLTRSSTRDDARSGLGIHVDIIEELEMVDVDIERLKREIGLTTRMIGKAELTGSYEELRLLKDSRASIERELARKERLRDAYSNQGGDHKLTVFDYREALTVGTHHD